MDSTPLVSRLAPSPSGRMHAGNIFAALVSWLMARSSGGEVVLRIDDLDVERSRPEFSEQLMRDFEALGLTWDRGPFYQQDSLDDYGDAYRMLEGKGLVYPCFCSRADLHAASAPHRGEKLVYPGTCRGLNAQQIQERSQRKAPAWRLIVPNERYGLDDLIQGGYSQNLKEQCGDFLIRRSDGHFAYQLACVVDDAAQGVNCVVRGMDLLPSTPQQLYLQELLGLPSGVYGHVPLVVGEWDRRLSKRDHDAALDALLERYGSPQGVLGHIAHLANLIPEDVPASTEEILQGFDPENLGARLPDKEQILWR